MPETKLADPPELDVGVAPAQAEASKAVLTTAASGHFLVILTDFPFLAGSGLADEWQQRAANGFDQRDESFGGHR